MSIHIEHMAEVSAIGQRWSEIKPTDRMALIAYRDCVCGARLGIPVDGEWHECPSCHGSMRLKVRSEGAC